jgi:Leucine-rich repeat (LRR) protein
MCSSRGSQTDLQRSDVSIMAARRRRVDVLGFGLGTRPVLLLWLIAACFAGHIASSAVSPVGQIESDSSSISPTEFLQRACPALCRCDNLTSVHSNKRLLTVDCSYQSLEIVPPDIASDTEALTLRGNHLKDIHEYLPTLANLIELDLSNNKIKTLGRGILFRNMTSLLYLNLAKNDLSTVFSDSLLGLHNLETLLLAENHITYIETDAFRVLKNLKRLSLESNTISSLYEEWFAGLKSLVNLTLAHNIIHHINRNVFRAVAELRELILSGNRINGIEPLGFNGLSKLEYLNLDNNLLAAVPTASLQPLKNLVRLHMDLNPISKLQAYSFSEIAAREVSLHRLHDLQIVDGYAFHDMYNLSVLIMHDNEKLAFIDPDAFKNVTALRKLYLHNNNLRGLSKKLNESLPNNVEMSINGNPLLCDCNIKWIKQEMLKLNSNASRIKFLNESQIICDEPVKYRNKTVKDLEFRKVSKECPPTIIDFTTNRTLIRKLGDPLTMECRALGIPLPNLHWLLPDGTVLNSTSNSVRMRLRNPGTLIFYHLNATDSGQYACVAENSMGSANVTVNLRVTGIDIHLFPTGISSTFITLVWNGTARNAFPSYKIKFKVADDKEWSDQDKQVGVSSFDRSYTINNLTPDTKYKFCITFVDKQGFYINISCTTAKTQDADFMMQGIHRTSNVAVGIVLAIIASMLVVICLVTLAAKKYRQRLYENPEKSTSNIPLDNLYSPLISSMGS